MKGWAPVLAGNIPTETYMKGLLKVHKRREGRSGSKAGGPKAFFAICRPWQIIAIRVNAE